MKKFLTILLSLTACAAAASSPLYIVNGRECDAEQMRRIDPSHIVSSEQLPVSDELIARYGQRAADGVIVVTLRYDTPPVFDAGGKSFREWVEDNVEWEDDDPAASVIYKYMVRRDGTVELTELIESTDSRLRTKVVRAVRKAPKWQPALSGGQPVEVEQVLKVQLPHGKRIPRERYVRML